MAPSGLAEVFWLLLMWFYLLGACFVAWVGSEKGRQGLAWFLLSLIVSPLLCMVALAALPALEPSQRARAYLASDGP